MKVVITPRGFARYGREELELFQEKGIEVDFNDTGHPYSPDVFLDKIRDADGLIVGVDECSRAVLEQCPSLKVICKFGVGVDNIDCVYAHEHCIEVGRTVGSNAQSVAEHAMALMFADARSIVSVVTAVKSGSWAKPTGIELAGKTLGIVGFGAIGRRLATLAHGIGMQVLAYDAFPVDRSVADSLSVGVSTLDQVLKNSDYVSVHVPLLDSTRGMISQHEFDLMGSQSCLINASRGGVVDEHALLQALKSGSIRSACFDVMEDEPPAADNPLLSLDNFMLTSHIGSRTHESERRTCRMAADIVLKVLQGS